MPLRKLQLAATAVNNVPTKLFSPFHLSNWIILLILIFLSVSAPNNSQWKISPILFVSSSLFTDKKRHPCKFLLELQALMSSPEKEGFELPTSSAKPADDYAVPPLQNCNKGRSDSGFAVFSMGKEISFLFFASPARRSGSVFFLFENKKRHQLSLMSLPEKEGFEPSRRVNDLYP